MSNDSPYEITCRLPVEIINAFYNMTWIISIVWLNSTANLNLTNMSLFNHTIFELRKIYVVNQKNESWKKKSVAEFASWDLSLNQDSTLTAKMELNPQILCISAI